MTYKLADATPMLVQSIKVNAINYMKLTPLSVISLTCLKVMLHLKLGIGEIWSVGLCSINVKEETYQGVEWVDFGSVISTGSNNKNI